LRPGPGLPCGRACGRRPAPTPRAGAGAEFLPFTFQEKHRCWLHFRCRIPNRGPGLPNWGKPSESGKPAWARLQEHTRAAGLRPGGLRLFWGRFGISTCPVRVVDFAAGGRGQIGLRFYVTVVSRPRTPRPAGTPRRAAFFRGEAAAHVKIWLLSLIDPPLLGARAAHQPKPIFSPDRTRNGPVAKQLQGPGREFRSIPGPGCRSKYFRSATWTFHPRFQAISASRTGNC